MRTLRNFLIIVAYTLMVVFICNIDRIHRLYPAYIEKPELDKVVEQIDWEKDKRAKQFQELKNHIAQTQMLILSLQEELVKQKHTLEHKFPDTIKPELDKKIQPDDAAYKNWPFWDNKSA